MYYVYKITNKINGHFYIGKRKHKEPLKDSYMGSGKLIKQAIQKHGKESFKKEILGTFNDHNEAALLESKLVTKEVISSYRCYNMHEGGMGGFAHINNGSPEHIDRCKRGAKNTSGRNHPNWGIRKFQKGNAATKKFSSIAIEALKKDKEKNPEKYKNIAKKISEYQTINNSMKNRIWISRGNEKKTCNLKEYPSLKKEGWISSFDRKEDKCSNMKMRWINKNGINTMVSSAEYQTKLKEGFSPGRISNKRSLLDYQTQM